GPPPGLPLPGEVSGVEEHARGSAVVEEDARRELPHLARGAPEEASQVVVGVSAGVVAQAAHRFSRRSVMTCWRASSRPTRGAYPSSRLLLAMSRVCE